MESNQAIYQHFLAPPTAESGLLFGTESGSIRAGLIFDTSNRLLFRNGGNTTRMTLTQAGDLGLGVTAPAGQLHFSLDEGRKPGTAFWTVLLMNGSKPYTALMTDMGRIGQRDPRAQGAKSKIRRKQPQTAAEVRRVRPKAARHLE